MAFATLALSDACSWPERRAVSLKAAANRCSLAEPIANAMREHFGVKPGDRVGMMMSDRPEFADVLLAIGSAGAIAVPLSVTPDQNEHTHAAFFFGARLLLATPALAGAAVRVANVLPALQTVLLASSAEYDHMVASEVGLPEPIWRAPDDLAWIFHSARAICRSKVAMLPYRNPSALIYSHLCDVRIL